MSTLSLSQDVTLWFDDVGQGEPLFVVSGLSGIASFWDPHLDAFSESYRVITHDHRGTGRSSRTRGDYSIEQMAGDVLAIADSLDLDSFNFVGHSTGGAIGQHLAVHHGARIRTLVLSSTWAGSDSYMQSLFTLRRDVLKDMGMMAYKRIGSLLLKPPALFKDNAYPSTEQENPADAHITLSRLQALLSFDIRDRLHEISAPTLVMCTEDDVITPPHLSRELSEKIQGSELVMLKTGGHFYPDTDPGDFQQRVLEFLARHPRRQD